MKLLKCPKCGEMFSDSYKECPFCQEDEAYLATDKKGKGPGRRVEKAKSPSILGPALIVVLVLLAAFLAYTFFGDKIAALFDGTDKPSVVDPIDDPAADALTVDKTELKLTVGDSAVLTASGADHCLWSSSDSAVASVDDNGNVSAVAEGTATITVSAGDASASCVVTVEKKAETKPEESKPEETKPDATKPEETKPTETKKNLKLMYSGGEVYKDDYGYGFTESVGNTLELHVDGTDSAVTWKIDNTSVGTISADGVFKAVGAGKATLTATVDGQTISCVVLVD